MRIRFAVSLAATVLAASAVSAVADEVGKEAFGQYCATCHGMDAKGAGPMTELLIEKPSDLTLLTKENDGEFPMLGVIHVIDGRTGVRGHGGSMPVYGAVFDSEASGLGPYGAPLYTRGKILSIAYYLESLQQ